MKNNKQVKTVTEQKMAIVSCLINNDFRCKDNEGNFLSATETDDILMAMPLATLVAIRKGYQTTINQKIETRRLIKPLFNVLMVKTGLGHLRGLR